MTETETSPAAPRTRAHDHKQLAAVLEWPAVHVDKAVVLGGILPDYGRPKTSRWSGPQVDDIETRRDEIAAGLDVSLLLDDDEMMTLLGLKWPDWTRGREHGIIPGPDRGRFWTRQLAADLAAKSEELREQIPPQPLGAFRCADLMKELSGIDTVTIDDFDMLVEQGHVECVDYWKQYALYDTGKVKQLATTDDGKALIAGLVADRVAWTENSVPLKTALRWLEWERRDFERTARELGIKEGRFARWAREDIARMAADEELAERVRRDRLLGPEQSAEHMEIRRTDFNYVVAAGWVRARAHAVKEVGRYKEVDIPLYATGDLEDALQIRGVPWEDVRAVKPGEESPLREYTRLPRKRADVIHAFCGEIRDRWSVETWPHYWSGPDKWQIDWEQSSDGHPAKKEVAALLSAHPGASRYRADIELATEVGDVIRTARACLEPGAAVILDTETTDLGGVAVEVAVIDAATGATL
ncbi:MAG: hypothetical protein FWE35_26945, partial [Streptosporangiales bacterium]|nr:hypothetical protein [Streptosporangiales bacterium]